MVPLVIELVLFLNKNKTGRDRFQILMEALFSLMVDMVEKLYHDKKNCLKNDPFKSSVSNFAWFRKIAQNQFFYYFSSLSWI
jgi:hypothetical protein